VSVIADVIIEPCKHPRGCKELCEREPQVDALSDTNAELKMIVTLLLGSHFSCFYRTCFSDTRGDKGDGLNTEEKQHKQI